MTQITITPEIKNTVANLPIAYMAHEVCGIGRVKIEQAVEYLADKLGIDIGDTSLRARALREYLGCIVNTWDPDDWEDMDEYEEYYRSCVMDAMENYGVACYELWDTFGDASFMYQWAMLAGDAKRAEYYTAEMAA